MKENNNLLQWIKKSLKIQSAEIDQPQKNFQDKQEQMKTACEQIDYYSEGIIIQEIQILNEKLKQQLQKLAITEQAKELLEENEQLTIEQQKEKLRISVAQCEEKKKEIMKQYNSYLQIYLKKMKISLRKNPFNASLMELIGKTKDIIGMIDEIVQQNSNKEQSQEQIAVIMNYLKIYYQIQSLYNQLRNNLKQIAKDYYSRSQSKQVISNILEEAKNMIKQMKQEINQLIKLQINNSERDYFE
eukprot:TRINITY_DN1505_c0_g1_i4.p2 TRINITY_DN1505_c0_g1~~TRINITY_DN1505_c0_g1_i4.p2  ORF type:complete len:244 (-),score=59.34 TRINITY_DN1505_c0_g1_i4:291-1022(-)